MPHHKAIVNLQYVDTTSFVVIAVTASSVVTAVETSFVTTAVTTNLVVTGIGPNVTTKLVVTLQLTWS